MIYLSEILSTCIFLFFSLQFTSRNMTDSLFRPLHWKRIFWKSFEKLKKQGLKSDKLAAKKRNIGIAAGNRCFIRIWAHVFKALRLRETETEVHLKKSLWEFSIRVEYKQKMGFTFLQGSKVFLVLWLVAIH